MKPRLPRKLKKKIKNDTSPAGLFRVAAIVVRQAVRISRERQKLRNYLITPSLTKGGISHIRTGQISEEGEIIIPKNTYAPNHP